MSEETIPQMRERIERLEKAEKEITSQRDSLRKENAQLKARDAFREEGYPASYGDLYAGQNGDAELTSESLDAFVTAFGLTKATAQSTGEESTSKGESESEAESGNADLALLARGGSRAGEGGVGSSTQAPMTRAEYMELAQTDPNAAKVAVSQGRVQLSRDNPYVPSQGRVSGPNPYVPTE
jgi:hypothetical protein